MTLRPGMLVGANVRLVRLLGQGGMGSVWVADHETLHTQVAVKFMMSEMTGNAEALARFGREASAAAQIKSPHVVQIFDHGVCAEGMPYIVMELLEGEDLSQRVAREGALPPRAVGNIIAQVCKALGRAHALGIIHRDIKPENIFLSDADGDLLAKVLDFGIAKQTQDTGFSMTTTGAMVGTPYYMSPEQVMSAKSVDARSDLWSLAVVTYHALTGKVPFDAETMGALCVAINSAEFQRPSALRPGISQAIDTWFGTALAREPSARFQSAKEMSLALQRAVGLLEEPAPDLAPSLATPQTLHSADAAAPAVSPAQPPMMPAAAGTLMEASITSSQSGPRRGLAIAVIAGALGLVAVLALVAVLVTRGRAAAESVPAASGTEAQVEGIPAAVETGTPAPTAPSVAPTIEAPAPSASAPDGNETKPPRTSKVGKPPATKVEEKPKPAETKLPATTAPPATTKPKDKYGF